MLQPKARRRLSFVSFNLGWWACFLGARYGWPMAGPLYCLVALPVHLWANPNRMGELGFVLLMTLIGTIFDSALMTVGLFQFPAESTTIAPPWLIAMWTLFAMAMENSEPLRRRIWVLMIVSAITAPLSYFAGEFSGKVLYARPLWAALGAHALLWAFLMPGLFLVRDWSLKYFRRSHKID